jgi:CheY-like chemotaxis protein
MGSKPLALVVDDNINNIQLVESYLKSFGYEYFSTINPLEVEDIINYKMPDVLLLDLNMPQEHGTETLKRLKSQEEFKDIPVIILTAETSDETLATCFHLGASDFITKPISEVVLKARLNSVLKIKNLTEENVQIEKLATVNAMIVTANHHLNQPLTVIKGHIELLETFSKDKFTEREEKHFKAIHQGIKRIQSIIEKLSKLKKIRFTTYTNGVNMIDIEKIDDEL